jgi:hypothetical protein
VTCLIVTVWICVLYLIGIGGDALGFYNGDRKVIYYAPNDTQTIVTGVNAKECLTLTTGSRDTQQVTVTLVISKMKVTLIFL